MSKSSDEKQRHSGQVHGVVMPPAEAWKVWMATDEGKQCADPAGIRAPGTMFTYLENRLWRAFMAGYQAAEKREAA